jgi:TolB protein
MRLLGVALLFVAILSAVSCGRDKTVPSGTPERPISTATTPAASAPDRPTLEGGAELDPLMEPGLYVIKSDGSDMQMVSGDIEWSPLGSNSNYAWSPDGTRLAFVVDEGGIATVASLQMWDVASGSLSGMSLAPLTSVSGFSWSPLDSEIAVLGYIENGDGLPHRVILLVDVDRGKAQVVFGGDERQSIEPSSVPTWSPDGQRMAVEVNQGAEMLVIGRDGTILGLLGAGFRPTWSPADSKVLFHKEDGLFAVSADGRGAGLLTADAFEYQWAPTGKLLAFTRHEEVAANEYTAFIYMIGSAGGALRITEGTQPSWAGDGERMVFLRDGNLAIVEALHRKVTQLTTSQFPFVSGPVWSPSSEVIAFLYAPGVESVVHIANADGSRDRALAPGFSPAFSPDGESIAFLSGRAGLGFSGSLYQMTVDGDAIIPLAGLGISDALPSCFGGDRFQWSPDGRKLLYNSGESIFTVAAGGDGEPKQVAEGQGLSWAPDGQAISYAAAGPQAAACTIYALGLGDRPDAAKPLAAGEQGVWSPDGDTIAAVLSLPDEDSKCHEYEIRAIDSRSGDSSPLARLACSVGGAPQIGLTWSPDSKRLAYVSDETIYLLDVSGDEEPLKLTQGSSPAWSPDGQRVALSVREQAGTDGVYVIGTASSSEPVRVSEGRNPAWSPNGTRITFIR